MVEKILKGLVLVLMIMLTVAILVFSVVTYGRKDRYKHELEYIKSGEYYEFITTENEMYEEITQSMLDYLEQTTYADIYDGFKAEKWLQWLAMNDTELFIKVYEFLKDYETKMV